MKSKKQKPVLILGKRPPPIGGVTVHVARLCEWLTQKGIAFIFVDVGRVSMPRVLWTVGQYPLVHVHGTNPFFLVLIAGWARITKTQVILTFHGDAACFGGVRRLLLRTAFRLVRLPIVLNGQSFTDVKTLNPNTILMSAFIPPPGEETLASYIAAEIRSKVQSHHPVILTYAYDLATDRHGREIYGIVEIVETFGGGDCLLVISDPSGRYQPFIRERLSAASLSNVVFVSEPHSLYALLRIADIFIRNTTTDGDALSVREALHTGVAVWATPCVSRPDGVRTYSSLQEVRFDEAPAAVPATPAVVDQLVNLYQRVANVA